MLEKKSNIPEFHTPFSQVLSTKDRQNYERDGYLVLPRFITDDICQLLIERANAIVNNVDAQNIKIIFSTKNPDHTKHDYFLDSADKVRCFFEEGAFGEDGELKTDIALCINKIGHALHDVDPIFNCFSRMHKIAMLIHELGINHPLLAQSMYVFKQPYFGGEVNCHQDGTFLYVENQPITGLWFALEEATLENGCLWAIPGGHKHGLKSRLIREGHDFRTETYDNSPWDLSDMVPLVVPRGSLIVLHGWLPHMSKENVSPKSRHAYTLHIMSGQDAYPTNNWLQRPAQAPFRGFL